MKSRDRASQRRLDAGCALIATMIDGVLVVETPRMEIVQELYLIIQGVPPIWLRVRTKF